MFFFQKTEIVKCTFGINPYRVDQFYGCRVSEQQIPENRELNFTGQHEGGKTNNDVLYVEFNRCTVTKVPQGLTKIFPNLKVIQIWNSKLKKIVKNDLVEYKNLEKLNFYRNEIEFLPGDLFENFISLKFIDFHGNKLKVIEPNILDGLEKLTYVDFRDNPNYNKFYSIYPEDEPNAKLDEIKIDLMDKFYIRIKLFQDLKEENQQLKDLNAVLNQQNVSFKNSNAKLQSKLEQEKIENFNLTLQLQKGIVDDIRTFIQDETTKDFQIQIDDHEFPVHKFLLAARSPTLAEILKNNPEVENLNLVDISVEIFEIILKFLYTDELPGEDGTNFLHLFAAAGKLKIEELKDYAAFKLMNHIDEENALDILKISNKYDHEALRQEAFKGIKKKYPNVELKDEWAADTEKLEKVFNIIKQREEADRKMEEEFKKLMN